jgi:transposase
MDEARFGTHSKQGHGWFETGKRSRVAVKLGFKNFYVYSAIEPSTGEAFSLILPQVNTQMMNIYLQELSSRYPNEDITLVVDGAGWHKSQALVMPKNIHIIYLPPYSPELNPVERFWLFIKSQTIRNKIYGSLQDLENEVCDCLNSILSFSIAQICAVDWFI